MKLDEYERLIQDAINEGTPDAAGRLSDLSAEIRRACWSGPYQRQAHELAATAEAGCGEICQRLELRYGGQQDRWPGGFNGAGNLVRSVP